MPASGPYVWPNDVLSEKNTPEPDRDAAATAAPTTAAPNASHDSAGWRRRGDQRNSIVDRDRRSARARAGQRTIAHASFNRVRCAIESPIDCAERERANASDGQRPAVTVEQRARARTSARVGRSCSTP